LALAAVITARIAADPRAAITEVALHVGAEPSADQLR
jgi:hypothetical protein